MSGKQQVDRAEQVARGLVDGRGVAVGTLDDLVDVVREFSRVEFDVPDLPDSDGHLFQYGPAGWHATPTFSLGIVRQLETVDPVGEHESYVQVAFELSYPVDDDLVSLGTHSDWWFPGGSVTFEAWLDSVRGHAVSRVVAARRPREFVIDQDVV